MLTIAHVPNAISVRAALTAADVERLATQFVETRDPNVIGPIERAVRATKEIASAPGADLRYAIRIRSGRTNTTIYIDAFGLRGIVDGRQVRFANDAIKRAIVAAFPQLSE